MNFALEFVLSDHETIHTESGASSVEGRGGTTDPAHILGEKNHILPGNESLATKK